MLGAVCRQHLSPAFAPVCILWGCDIALRLIHTAYQQLSPFFEGTENLRTLIIYHSLHLNVIRLM